MLNINLIHFHFKMLSNFENDLSNETYVGMPYNR